MRITSPCCALLVAGATLGPCHLPSALAQAQPERKYIQVGFMKVVEGKGADYTKLEQMWKPIHQDRVNKGQIESWSLYSVRFPMSSTSREYDAVTIAVVGPFAKMERPYDDAQQEKIRSFPPAGEIRKQVRVEVWYVHRTVGTDLFASKFAMALFLKAKPGKLADYLRAQQEHYVSINEDLVKSGVRKAWHSLGVMYPSGTQREYDWLSFDGFDRFDAPATNTAAGIDPQRLTAANQAVTAHRDTIRSEYWQLVDRTAPK